MSHRLPKAFLLALLLIAGLAGGAIAQQASPSPKGKAREVMPERRAEEYVKFVDKNVDNVDDALLERIEALALKAAQDQDDAIFNNEGNQERQLSEIHRIARQRNARVLALLQEEQRLQLFDALKVRPTEVPSLVEVAAEMPQAPAPAPTPASPER